MATIFLDPSKFNGILESADATTYCIRLIEAAYNHYSTSTYNPRRNTDELPEM
jgi:hypothetical protein